MWRLAQFLHKLPLMDKVKDTTLHQWLWYTLIGAITFVVTNMLLFIFRRLLALPDVLSVMISYALMTVCHFILHNNLTFRKSMVPLRNKLSGHLAVSLINYFVGVTITMLILKVFIDSNLIATAISTSVTLVLGFTLLNRFVYKLYAKGKKYDDYC